METTTPLLTPPPDLGGIITTADIEVKGTGAYQASYVNWARIAHLLHVHAPGWQFHLVPTANGEHVHRAPDGTGYVMGQFTSPEGFTTASFPQAVMDNRNNAIPLERISARDVTDTHRRCLCTAAAAQFSLAWQLWAKEPVEDPHRQPEPSTLPRDELQRQVLHRLKDLGVTAEGMTTLVTRAGGTKGLGTLDDKVLHQLLTGTITPEKVDDWNSEGARAAEAAADVPLHHLPTAEPVAAPASRGRQRSAA